MEIVAERLIHRGSKCRFIEELWLFHAIGRNTKQSLSLSVSQQQRRGVVVAFVSERRDGDG